MNKYTLTTKVISIQAFAGILQAIQISVMPRHTVRQLEMTYSTERYVLALVFILSVLGALFALVFREDLCGPSAVPRCWVYLIMGPCRVIPIVY